MKRKIKAIKIDADTRKVYEILMPNNLDGIYSAVECRRFDVIRFQDMDILVDEEKEMGNGFYIRGRKIYGNGVVISYDYKNSCNADATQSLDYIQSLVRFFD
jgi:hypothetical protein